MKWLYLVAAGLLAVAAVALGNRSEAPKRTANPQAIVKSTSGAFKQPSSRSGMPIFTASSLAAGGTASGDVTIANTGTLKGYFYLSQSQLTDSVGPAGGSLSTRLRLTVRDVTSPGAPTTVYSGAFAAMDAQPLGFIAPDAARRYSFAARFLDGGAEPAAGTGAFEGSSTSVRYVWSALGDSPRRDRRPPRLRVSIPPVQQLLELHRLTVRAACNERCRVGVDGDVSTTGSGAVATPRIRNLRVRPNRDMVLQARIPDRMRASVRGALLRSQPVTIRLRLTARDEAGNLAVVERTVRLKPTRG